MTIFDLIGNTPLVEIKNIAQFPNVSIYGKLEGNNPGGSVKDRAALYMIQSALDRGDIKEGDRLVEATSGNTGIALAMMAQKFKVKMTLIMPENATQERIKSMRAYGAEVILTPAYKTIEYSRELAEKMAAEEDYFILNQFANPDNPRSHYETTGPEIWKNSRGEVSHFVSSMGTTGTIMGVSTYLKEMDPGIQIIGVQPTDDAKIPGIRKWPKEYLPKIFDPKKVDRVMEVSQEEATQTARRLAKEEGIFAGMSSGGATAVALRLAASLDRGTVVTIICDRGDRYLSSDLFS